MWYKTKKIIFSVILFSLLVAIYSFSCTSFYVASGEKFVGMNYDYPDREIIVIQVIIILIFGFPREITILMA